jgi:hypothetical protein
MKKLIRKFQNSYFNWVLQVSIVLACAIFTWLTATFALAYLAIYFFTEFKKYAPGLHELILWYTSTVF